MTERGEPPNLREWWTGFSGVRVTLFDVLARPPMDLLSLPQYLHGLERGRSSEVGENGV
jgi:hypothetical protein